MDQRIRAYDHDRAIKLNRGDLQREATVTVDSMGRDIAGLVSDIKGGGYWDLDARMENALLRHSDNFKRGQATLVVLSVIANQRTVDGERALIRLDELERVAAELGLKRPCLLRSMLVLLKMQRRQLQVGRLVILKAIALTRREGDQKRGELFRYPLAKCGTNGNMIKGVSTQGSILLDRRHRFLYELPRSP